MKNDTMLADLIRETVIVQGLIALMVVAGTFGLLLTGHPVDDRVWMIDTAVLGYFFGARGIGNIRIAHEASSRFMAALVRQNCDLLERLLARRPEDRS